MEKLLYVSKRVRVDLSTTIVFLCTRVSKSIDEDWEKLRRLLQYLKGTISMKIILGNDGLECMRTYIDASYATHMDMKRHMGGG